MNPNEEVICGFTVTEKRKKVWAVQLEMVREFISICEKYNLVYFASSGTLIGCIRHSGYIPWDDDIDLMMLRKDYEKFLEVAAKELPAHYFLQHYSTEKNYPNGHIQIRDNRTSCFLTNGYNDLKSGKNCGIFIDIFPMDFVPDNPEKRAKQAKKVLLLRRLAMSKVYGGGRGVKSLIKKIAVRTYFIFHNLQKTIEKIDKLAVGKGEKTDTVALFTFCPGYEKNVWDASLFSNAVQHKFEDFTMAMPEDYDAVLRIEYGDYMQIPEVKGISMHGSCFFDTDKPYSEYVGLSYEEYVKLFDDTL